jgi:hypothetical protein
MHVFESVRPVDVVFLSFYEFKFDVILIAD